MKLQDADSEAGGACIRGRSTKKSANLVGGCLTLEDFLRRGILVEGVCEEKELGVGGDV